MWTCLEENGLMREGGKGQFQAGRQAGREGCVWTCLEEDGLVLGVDLELEVLVPLRVQRLLLHLVMGQWVEEGVREGSGALVD